MDPSFPIYRKLRGGAHLYRIESIDRFTELQRVGSKWLRHLVVATQYPERLRIVEMIQGEGPSQYELAMAPALSEVDLADPVP